MSFTLLTCLASMGRVFTCRMDCIFQPIVESFIARGAHAPSRVAVGAPADRFFSLLYHLYGSSLGDIGA